MAIVVQKSGITPAMFNSGISKSASQTINISITKLNKLKVKIRRGSDSSFNIGAMAGGVTIVEKTEE